MLDPIIKAHIIKQDMVEEKLRSDIDKIIDLIDVDEFIDNPQEKFILLADMVEELVADRYFDQPIRNGIEIGQKLEDMKRKIVIQGDAPGDINESPKLLRDA